MLRSLGWFFLCVYVCVHALSRVWLCDPMNCSPHRLLSPRDSPGKNTGVGCHFLRGGNHGIGEGFCFPQLLDNLILSEATKPPTRLGSQWAARGLLLQGSDFPSLNLLSRDLSLTDSPSYSSHSSFFFGSIHLPFLPASFLLPCLELFSKCLLAS